MMARYSKPTRGIRYAEGGVSDENYINYYAVEIQADIEAWRRFGGEYIMCEYTLVPFLVSGREVLGIPCLFDFPL